MSKTLKLVISFSYAYLFFQYLRIALQPITTDIELEYLYSRPQFITKNRRLYLSKKYHNLTTYIQSFKKPKRFKTDLKFVLKYTDAFLHYASPLYGNGQKPFVDSNCTYYNCYLTTQRNLLNDFRDFDAILFDVENSWDGPIVMREPYQRFVFMASESAARFPLCDAFYDNFYNLSWTYRLDSDIQWGYFNINDKKGNFVGPKINMTWISPMEPTPLKVKKELGGKTKAAAWFVSNCNAGGGRNNVTKQIQKGLEKYNLTVDIYGWCGTKKCPKDRIEECYFLLKSDYYFYLAFENSLCTDYVTEKVLYPLNNYAIPIVYGAANYSRFLPPGSYINALELTATEVVDKMIKAIRNPNVYADYFRWHNYYDFVQNPKDPDVCRLCQILNEDADKRYWYKDFRSWWNPDYPKLCTNGGGRVVAKNRNSLKGIMEIEKNMQGDM